MTPDQIAEIKRRVDSFNTPGLLNNVVLGNAYRQDVPALIAEVARLRDANRELFDLLKEARSEVEDWAAYASDYMKEKHCLNESLEKIDAAIQKHGEGK